MDTYEGELLQVFLGKRVWFRRRAHAQLNQGFSNLGREVFKHVMTVLGKVGPLTTMSCLSFQDGVIEDNEEIRDCRLHIQIESRQPEIFARRTIIDVGEWPHVLSLADMTGALPRDTAGNRQRDLNGTYVLNAQVHQFSFRNAEDCRGAEQVCLQVPLRSWISKGVAV